MTYQQSVYLSAITVTNISKSFYLYRMAAKINWHRQGTKLRVTVTVCIVYLVDDDAEGPDIGERGPAASVGRVGGDDLGRHPAQRDDAPVTDVEVLVGVHVAAQARQRHLNS